MAKKSIVSKDEPGADQLLLRKWAYIQIEFAQSERLGVFFSCVRR